MGHHFCASFILANFAEVNFSAHAEVSKSEPFGVVDITFLNIFES
jgi:hypothetical protein